jgi:hypothetical protein
MMEKFLSQDFLVLLLLAAVLLIVHEFGHWVAYRLCGYQAVIRKSVLVPGIDPKVTIVVNRFQGLFIALNGFVLSALVVLIPSFAYGYRLWPALLLGGIAGASVDFIWAFSMLFQKEITISSRR